MERPIHSRNVLKKGTMMRLQWTSDLDIDALEAKRHWATMEELLEVVGRYSPRYA